MTAGTNYTISFDYGNNSTTYKENLKVMFGTAADYNVMINPIVDLSSINDGVLHSVSYTFTVPANVKEYTIRPLNDEIIKVIKAYVRN